MERRNFPAGDQGQVPPSRASRDPPVDLSSIDPHSSLRPCTVGSSLGLCRTNNGPEFVAIALREWIAAVGAKTAYIQPGSPWENGYCESFKGKLRDELLYGQSVPQLA